MSNNPNANTWLPKDITAKIKQVENGTLSTIKPTVGALTDGTPLFYAQAVRDRIARRGRRRILPGRTPRQATHSRRGTSDLRRLGSQRGSPTSTPLRHGSRPRPVERRVALRSTRNNVYRRGERTPRLPCTPQGRVSHYQHGRGSTGCR